MTEEAEASGKTPERGLAARVCAPALDPDLRALVERAALVPNGMALLHRGPLECAAVLLAASPRALERARTVLEGRRARAAALRIARDAARRTGPREEGGGERGAVARSARDPEALIAAARERSGGLAVLLSAADECAAIAFGVHPDAIAAARRLALERGLSPGSPRSS